MRMALKLWALKALKLQVICSTISALASTDILHLWTALALAAYSSSSQERKNSREHVQPASAICSKLASKAWLYLYMHAHTHTCNNWSRWKMYYTTLTTPVQSNRSNYSNFAMHGWIMRICNRHYHSLSRFTDSELPVWICFIHYTRWASTNTTWANIYFFSLIQISCFAALPIPLPFLPCLW